MSAGEGASLRRTYVLSPSPSEIALDDGAPDDWSDHSSADDGECIGHNGRSTLRGVPDIPQHAARISDGSGSEQTGKEAG